AISSNGNLFEFVQFGLAEATLQRLGLEVLDGVPTDLEVLGHVLNSYVLGQFQGVTLESTGVAFLGSGETHLGLGERTAGEAVDPRHLEVEERRLATDRHRTKGAVQAALVPDLVRATGGAAVPFPGLFDAKGHGPLLEGLAQIAVA